MGVAELDDESKTLRIRANIITYGGAASQQLAEAIANDISGYWSEPHAFTFIKGAKYTVVFLINGTCVPELKPEDVVTNTDPLNNYFRIEEYAGGNISFVDGLNSNTGYFKKDNLLNNSTTAAHEFGHSLGLDHPEDLDIRGKGVPGIMYPRGTITDPQYQYDPTAAPGAVGGTLNPFLRKVRQEDVDMLGLSTLSYKNTRGIIGDFTSFWHEAHLPG